MHPELLNNSLFLKYYKQWQEDPSTIVFVPIAEYLLLYGLVGEAYEICCKGVKLHPAYVSGHIIMAKIEMKRGRWDEADKALRQALEIVPSNSVAEGLMKRLEVLRAGVEYEGSKMGEDAAGSAGNAGVSGWAPHEGFDSWNTVTMARIYTAQGHYDRARRIYRTILSEDPDNETVRKELDSLPLTGDKPAMASEGRWTGDDI